MSRQSSGRSWNSERLLLNICVAGLVLGFGSTATLFACIHAAFFKSLPYPNPEQLFLVDVMRPSGISRRVTPAELELLRSSFRDKAMVAGLWDTLQATLAGEYAGPVSVVSLESDLLRLLGVRPVIGRLPNSNSVNECVLSESLWRARLDADSDLIGKPLAYSDSECIVVGVMPSAFFFPEPKSDVWVPLPPRAFEAAMAHQSAFLAFARFDDPSAAASARTVAVPQEGSTDNASQLRVRPLLTVTMERYRPALTALSLAVLAVLVLSAVNLASYVRTTCADRTREWAIRLALGGTRWSLMREVLKRALTVALPAAIGGLGVSQLMISALHRLDLPDLWWLRSMRLSLTTIAALLLTTLVVGIVAAASSAARVVQADIRGELIRSSHFYQDPWLSRAARWSVAIQMGCATGATVLAILFILSYFHALTASWGFNPANLILVEAEVPK